MHAFRTCLATLLAGVMLFGLTSCTSRGTKDSGSPPLARAFEGVHEPAPQLSLQDNEFNTEEYGRITENEFLGVADNPLSTFSIDVDTASYSNVRRFITSGRLPPADAVRIEEMVNYFKYDYPQPQGNQPFSVTTEVAGCPWNPSHKLVHIGLQGRQISLQDAPPSNLVFLIDTSGSMDQPDKLPLLKSAFRLLVNHVREQDRVAIVVYAGSAGLVLASTAGGNKREIMAAISRLEAGGSTAGGAGIKLAYEVARQSFIPEGNNRVILATDGDFNVGTTSEGELLRLIEEKRESGVFLSVLGFGTGNIKDSKMELLADKGNGNYAYIDTISEARKVLVSQVGGTLNTIAKDVKIQVEFNPARVTAYRLIGYENRLMRAEEFNDDKKDAGELGAGHTVTALYEIVPPGASTSIPKVDPLKYQQKDVKPEAFATNEIMVIKLRYKQPKSDTSVLLTKALDDANADPASASENVRFAAAVAEFGMLLRGSKFRGEANYQSCLALARDARSNDEEGYRAEFIALVETASSLPRADEQARAAR